MQDKKQIFSIIGFIVVIVLIIGAFAYFSDGKGKGSGRQGFYEGLLSFEKMAELSSCPLTADKDAFAKCLTEKGWVMYGAEWCSHCKEQKALFGDSFQYIKYVECPDNVQLCLNKGVNGYPTWIVEAE
jgi:hypothetical protein